MAGRYGSSEYFPDASISNAQRSFPGSLLPSSDDFLDEVNSAFNAQEVGPSF